MSQIDLFGYERPALEKLVTAMGKLSRRQRIEVARMGRRAKAAKQATIRRLAREAAAEHRALSHARTAW